MITLVTRGDTALLARGVQFRGPMYSCLAGFVEPGESLEGAVVREVREEVGIEVGDVRYWGSQPWPFPHSLMVGFTATWKSGEIEIDPAEIVDAQWFRRDDAAADPAADLDRPQADRRLAARGLGRQVLGEEVEDDLGALAAVDAASRCVTARGPRRGSGRT